MRATSSRLATWRQGTGKKRHDVGPLGLAPSEIAKRFRQSRPRSESLFERAGVIFSFLRIDAARGNATMPANGPAPVFQKSMVLGLDVQRVRTEARSADGVVPTAEMSQDVVGGELREGIEFPLGRSATEFFGDFFDGTYDLLFVRHGMRRSKNALVQRR